MSVKFDIFLWRGRRIKAGERFSTDRLCFKIFTQSKNIFPKHLTKYCTVYYLKKVTENNTILTTMKDLTGNQVTINGISGIVTVDHQDGTYSVYLVDNTVYFATIEEIAQQIVTVEQPTVKKVKATKFHQVYKAVKNCQEVTVKTKNGTTRPCVVTSNYERNYFNVQTIDGEVFNNVHINRINPNGGMCHMNRGGYVSQVLKAMECYL